MTVPRDRAGCAALDADDPLRHWRDEFLLDDGLVYLDGNSLGALPRSVPERVAAAVREEWGRGLVRSWNTAAWIDMPRRVGARLAPLLGVAADEVIAADSTSVNLFKLLAAAASARPGRRTVVMQTEDFPTDVYIGEGLAGLARTLGGSLELRTAGATEVTAALGPDVAVVALTHVDYRSGRMHDMAAVTAAAHDAGALMLWDLSHSAGAMPLDLGGCGTDLAVGCGYKYLNGGPGAPAFVMVARRLQEAVRSPLTGWLGHAEPFAFEGHYRPADGVARMACGTPPILSMTALEAALEMWSRIDLHAVREKSVALGDLLIALVEARVEGRGVTVVSPRDARLRGSQVSVRHADGYAVMRALIDRGVVGDFRAPDVLRFGLTPLYTRYVDVWDAVEALRDVLDGGAHRDPRYRVRATVT